MSSLARLLLVEVRELLLAFPADDADLGSSNKEEISTLATVAGFLASSCVLDQMPKTLRTWTTTDQNVGRDGRTRLENVVVLPSSVLFVLCLEHKSKSKTLRGTLARFATGRIDSC